MADRTRREPDPFLDWKIRVFFAGAALLVPGVLLGYDALVLLAIVILAGGLMLLTVLSARHRRQTEAAAAEEWEETEDEPEAGPSATG